MRRHTQPHVGQAQMLAAPPLKEAQAADHHVSLVGLPRTSQLWLVVASITAQIEYGQATFVWQGGSSLAQ